MEITTVKIDKPDDANIILGQAHFIKTIEDIYEVIVTAVPQMKFGVAFSEASGPCKIRVEGNDEGLRKMAADNVIKISAGHCFLVMMKEGFPINILNQVKQVAEVCSIFAATANPVEVVVADTGEGRGILGVVDGFKPKGIEDQNDITARKEFLRKIGYKR